MSEPSSIVATTSGALRGTTEGGISRFLGIPYAAPPVGQRRFRPPAPPEAWDGVREATSFGPICPQTQGPDLGSPLPDLNGRDQVMDEDCLTLNVWTPGADGGRRPVIVWIHGGAFTVGTASTALYDGTTFAHDGAVLVSINYRLHALGFLYLDELFDGMEGSGNCGIGDQAAALAWVRDNIAAFGGDPANVTIMGESAGAMSVGTLLALPAAAGLFRRAIALSGASHHNLPTPTARLVAERVLELVDVAPGDRDALLAVPTEALVAAAGQVSSRELGRHLRGQPAGLQMIFLPTVDGTVLPERAYELVTGGASDGVDLLISTCADEFRTFIWNIPEPLRSKVAPVPSVARYFPGGTPDEATILEVYGRRRPGAERLDLLAAMATDAVFGIPGRRLADAKSARGDRVWAQQLTWGSPVNGGELGACHGLDLPFVFDRLADNPGFVGEDPPESLARAMHGACVRFAATGDPNGGDLPPWEPWSVENRAVLLLDDKPELAHDPLAEEHALWDGSW